MDDYREIQVSFNDLTSAANKLSTMSDNIRSRKLDVSFQNSRGETADALIALSKALKIYGETFSDLVYKCSKNIKHAASEFKNADEEKAATLFCSVKGTVRRG